MGFTSGCWIGIVTERRTVTRLELSRLPAEPVTGQYYVYLVCNFPLFLGNKFLMVGFNFIFWISSHHKDKLGSGNDYSS
jgi:hypothetical protein